MEGLGLGVQAPFRPGSAGRAGWGVAPPSDEPWALGEPAGTQAFAPKSKEETSTNKWSL